MAISSSGTTGSASDKPGGADSQWLKALKEHKKTEDDYKRMVAGEAAAPKGDAKQPAAPGA